VIAVGEGGGLRHHVVGEEARGEDLGLEEGGIALPLRELARGDLGGAREASRPPSVMPISFST